MLPRAQKKELWENRNSRSAQARQTKLVVAVRDAVAAKGGTVGVAVKVDAVAVAAAGASGVAVAAVVDVNAVVVAVVANVNTVAAETGKAEDAVTAKAVNRGVAKAKKTRDPATAHQGDEARIPVRGRTVGVQDQAAQTKDERAWTTSQLRKSKKPQ